MGVDQLERAAPPRPAASAPAGEMPAALIWVVAVGLLGLRAAGAVAGVVRLVAVALARAGATSLRALALGWHTRWLPALRRGRRRLGAWWEAQGLPALLTGLVLAALGGTALWRRVAAGAVQVDAAAGCLTARAVGRADDALALLLLVRLPAAWAWSRPRLGALVRRGSATAQRIGSQALGGARAGGVVTGRRIAASARWLLPRLPRIALRSSLAGVGLAVLVASGGVAADLAVRHAARGVDVTTLPALAEPSQVTAADGTVLARLHGGIRREVVALEAVPPHVRDAVIASEDHRFAAHRGYDPESIGRATLANLRAGRTVQGGSTITQQLAKLNFVGDERVLQRKVDELVHAVALERAYTKDALLERYLNQVYLGAGAYGVAEGAREFFDAEVGDLTVEQGALLAALIRSPGSFDPRADPVGAEQRRNRVLHRMALTGRLAPAAVSVGLATPVALSPPRRTPTVEPYVVAAVRRELLADPAYGGTREEREALLLTGGLRVETSIRPDLQAIAREEVAARFPDPAGPTAAIAAVEPGTGRVLALRGGEDFAAAQFDLATQARRQPGSLLKPLMAVAVLEGGADAAAPLDGRARATYQLQGERWAVSNYGSVDHGIVDLHGALVASVNTAFADLAERVGIDPLLDITRRVGIDTDRAFGPTATHGPSIVLGGLTHGVSPLEMAGAYAPFVDGGRFAEPHLIDRVLGTDGEVLHEPPAAASPALDPEATATVAAALRDVVVSGTGQAAALPGADALGKTGTTSDGADAWFVGATESLATAVWVGHPASRARVPGGTGGTVAAPLWRDFTQRATAALAQP